MSDPFPPIVNQPTKPNRRDKGLLDIIGFTSVRPRGQFRHWLNICGGTFAAALVLLISSWSWFFSYKVNDYDPGLTRRARSALPIIAALSAYQHDKGKVPLDVDDLVPYLPAGTRVIPKTARAPSLVAGWEYDPILGTFGYINGTKISEPSNSKSYLLILSLFQLGERGATLNYTFDGAKGIWEYIDGDSGEDKVILLSP